MEQVSQLQCIESMESTLRKLSNAYRSVEAKSGNTSEIMKRWDAVQMGLASLQSDHEDAAFEAQAFEILASIDVLKNLLSSVRTHLLKAKEGSPQKTLLVRRMAALEKSILSLQVRLV